MTSSSSHQQGSPSDQEVPAELATAVQERDALQLRLDTMLNHEVTEWLAMERTLSAGIGDYESTISWRVTKPLRLLRMFQFAARDEGIASATRLAVSFVNRRNRGN